MLTPEQEAAHERCRVWNELLDPHREDRDVKKIREAIALKAREHLATVAPGLTVTTGELLEAFYPREIADQSLRGDRARHALSYQLLECTKKELSDCCIKGEVNGQFMGRPKRPWLWFFAEPRETCPHCGQVMPEDTQ